MQLQHDATITGVAETLCKVTSSCWSPDMLRLATCTTNRVVFLFDETGKYIEQFSTKPAPNCGKNYVVKGMVFSTDSSQLAIAQSDCSLHVYMIGNNWGDKKSVRARYVVDKPVTCCVWPAKPNDVVFGCADGSVKTGKNNRSKASILYNTDSYVVSICSNPEGSAIVSGHLDGSIYIYRFGDDTSGRQPTSTKFVTHPTTPYALTWGVSICAAGNDCRVIFYDAADGSTQRSFDYKSDPLVKEFETGAANPDGDCIVMGNYNRFYIYSYQTKTKSWEQSYEKRINNILAITTTCWRPDGSRVIIGSMTGSIEMFEVSLRRCKQGQFEYNYVSPSRIIITDTESETNDTAVRLLYSNRGYSIDDVHIYRSRFMIAKTCDTIIVGDFETKKISEIPWKTSNKEKFAFDYDKICLISNLGELTIVEYGRNEILGSFRTEHVSQHLISVRNNERVLIRNGEKLANNRKIAYLLDLITIRVVDIQTNATIATINHDCRIDFIELNPRCTHLVFRDKHRQLHLYDFLTQKKTTLLTFCSYVQWVPFSDVIVAQNKNTMCIWYTLSNPDRMTKREIKGEIETIDRKNGLTEVILFDGENYIAEPLNEGLIGFGIAIEDGDLQQAQKVLESIPMTDETEGMWRELLTAADEKDDYLTAERCAAALGDVSSSRYINKINKLSLKYPKDPNDKMARDHWMVAAKKEMYNNNYKSTEKILCDHNKIDDAIQMYQVLHKYDDAIRVAERTKHKDTENMKINYFKYLIDSGQQDKAGRIKEEEGDFQSAINLYLEGGLPVMAANLAAANRKCGDEVCERIIQALLNSNLFEKAGNFLEDMNNPSRALDCYIRGRVYQSAVELSRKNYPDKVVSLEEEWGDYLVTQQAIDAAINHYIESGAVQKAINAAIESRQWRKAVQMISDALPRNEAGPYFIRVAEHYRETGEYNLAVNYYVKAGKPEEAIEMYNSVKRWSEAERIAETYFKADEYKHICLDQAKRLEVQREFKEAERLYIRIDDPDSAVLMYKKAKLYPDMIRIVTQHRPNQVKDAHISLAQQLELDKDFREAEHHYIEGGDWQAACNMYTLNNEWDEAMRVAKYNGGVTASNNVAYNWARKLGGENGIKQLRKLGLIEQCIDYAIECQLFDEAFEIARQSLKSKLPSIHSKYAEALEVQNKLQDAEKEYIRATLPTEAIDMYIEKKMWGDALRLATEYSPVSIPEIYIHNAKENEDRKDYSNAEDIYMKASRPDLVIDMYSSVDKWDDAIRVARDYAPQRVRELEASKIGGGSKVTGNHITAGQMFEQRQQFDKAIECYLQATLFEANNNADVLERTWEKAVVLASKHQRSRLEEIVVRVSSLLSTIQRFENAGDLLKDIGKVEDALELYISAKEWTKAQDLANKSLPNEIDRVKKLYSEFLSKAGNTDELLRSGDDQSAINLLIKKNEWEKVLRIVQQDPKQKAFYSVRYANYLFSVHEIEKTFLCLKEYGVAIDPDSLSIIRTILQECFGRSKKLEEQQPSNSFLVREVLKVLTNLLRQANAPASVCNEFDRFLLISHYYYLRDYFYEQPKCQQLRAQVSISLLRFCDLLPPDKLFYQAGEACQSANILNMTMALWNRYLDIIEAMEDGSISSIDNSDFQIADIPSPDQFYVPTISYLSEDEQEDLRNWVLTTSMDTKVSQDLSLRSCPSCNQRIYQATLKCPYCNTSFQTCVVTGFPVTNLTQCTRCGSSAEIDNWNEFVSVARKCPYCDEMQSSVSNYK